MLLVRHGLPDYRDGLPGDEPPGPPLSSVGSEQARQAAAVVRQHKPQAIHCSPLARARQTAAILAGACGTPLLIDTDLREWHRTERLFEISVRTARWLVGWLRGTERCAVVVSHASPLLAILRSALYLPHVGWHRTGHPEQMELSSADRFEVSMASVFELTFEPRWVSAECSFHPDPRVMSVLDGRIVPCLPRAVGGTGENRCVRRPNRLHLLGYRTAP